MSTPSTNLPAATGGASAGAGMSEKQAAVLSYLQSYRVNEELNTVVNRLCHVQSDDPFGFICREFAARAKPPTITKLVGREILDSRANPTVECDVYGQWRGSEQLLARAGAPSGASTGSNEAHEMRDGDATRYGGKGVLKAVNNVSTALSEAVKGSDPRDLRAVDAQLCQADGTRLKTNLGGNAITAASFALAEAGAKVQEKELYLHLAAAFHTGNGNGSSGSGSGSASQLPSKFSLPRPMVNILNGGKHAGGELRIQEFMIVPAGGRPFREMLRQVTEVYHALGKLLVKKKGLSAKNLGDEGGFAPLLESPHEALSLIEEAIANAGFKANEDMFLALDCAASEFYADGKYEVEKGKFLTSSELVQYYLKLKKDHPALISIEDGLDEKDYDGWKALTEAFAKEHPGFMLVGDDLYTTNTDLIKQGVANKWANALLLKVNQIGTVSEAMDAARLIFQDQGQVIVSHRSGETINTLISDLAVGIGAGFIKTGAPARSERGAKYNRLLAIEELLQAQGQL